MLIVILMHGQRFSFKEFATPSRIVQTKRRFVDLVPLAPFRSWQQTESQRAVIEKMSTADALVPFVEPPRCVETVHGISRQSKGNVFIPIFSYQRPACLFVGSLCRPVHRHFGRYQTHRLSNCLSRLKVFR